MRVAVAKRPVEQFETEVTLPEWQLEPDEEAYFGQPDNGALYVDADGNPVDPPAPSVEQIERDASRPEPQQQPSPEERDPDAPPPDQPRRPPPERLDREWLDRAIGNPPPPRREPGN
jgi:penicillin-binding protein 1A